MRSAFNLFPIIYIPPFHFDYKFKMEFCQVYTHSYYKSKTDFCQVYNFRMFYFVQYLQVSQVQFVRFFAKFILTKIQNGFIIIKKAQNGNKKK